MGMKREIQNYRGQNIKEQKLSLNTERAKKTTQSLKHTYTPLTHYDD